MICHPAHRRRFLASELAATGMARRQHMAEVASRAAGFYPWGDVWHPPGELLERLRSVRRLADRMYPNPEPLP